MSYGRYFEEFTVGQVFQHWPGRTISEADCTWFALLTMNQHPLHSDAHYAETHTQHGQRVVLGPLVFSVVIGMTVADISGRAIANLEVETRSCTRSPPSSATRSTRGAACSAARVEPGRSRHRDVETRVHQPARRAGVLLSAARSLVPKKNHPTLGEGRLPY